VLLHSTTLGLIAHPGLDHLLNSCSLPRPSLSSFFDGGKGMACCFDPAGLGSASYQARGRTAIISKSGGHGFALDQDGEKTAQWQGLEDDPAARKVTLRLCSEIGIAYAPQGADSSGAATLFFQVSNHVLLEAESTQEALLVPTTELKNFRDCQALTVCCRTAPPLLLLERQCRGVHAAFSQEAGCVSTFAPGLDLFGRPVEAKERPSVKPPLPALTHAEVISGLRAATAALD